MALLITFALVAIICSYYLLCRGSVLRDGASQLLVVILSSYIIGGLCLCLTGRSYYVDSYIDLGSAYSTIIFEHGILSLSGIMLAALMLRRKRQISRPFYGAAQSGTTSLGNSSGSLTSSYGKHVIFPILVLLASVLIYTTITFFATNGFFYADWANSSRLESEGNVLRNILKLLFYEAPSFLMGILSAFHFMRQHYISETKNHLFLIKSPIYLPILSICMLLTVRGDRSTLILAVMPLILAAACVSRSRYVLLFVGMALQIVAALLSVFRTFIAYIFLDKFFSIQDLFSALENYLLQTPEASSVLNIASADTLAKTWGYLGGDVLFSTAIGLLPRFLSESSSLSFRSSSELLTQKMFSTIYSEGGGVGSFFSLDGFLDYGPIGIFLYAFIFSWLIFWIYSYFSINSFIGFSVKSSILIFYSVYSVRSGQLISIKHIIIYTSLAVLYLILYRALSSSLLYIFPKKPGRTSAGA